MYGNRDDRLPRPSEIINHFRLAKRQWALDLVRDAFKKAWGPDRKVECPLDFKVNVGFGEILSQEILDAVQSELETHGWTNYRLEEHEGQHLLLVKLDPDEARPYVRLSAK